MQVFECLMICHMYAYMLKQYDFVNKRHSIGNENHEHNY